MSFKITNKGPRSIAVLVPGGPSVIKAGKSDSFDQVPTNLDALVKAGAISQEDADKGRKAVDDATAKRLEEQGQVAAAAAAAAQAAATAVVTPSFVKPAPAATPAPAADGAKTAPAAQTPAAPVKAASAPAKGGTA